MKTLTTLKRIALIMGICLLIFFVINRIIPIYLKTETGVLWGGIVNFIIYGVIRVISAILCLEISERIYRNKIFWGILGFILPPIGLIVIALINSGAPKITNPDQGVNSDQ
jgi:hypothetical protein